MTQAVVNEKTEQILAGAMQEFLAQGYAGTSMDRVAAAAGVSKATVYSHFQDKEGLFRAIVQQMAKRKFAEVFSKMDEPWLQDNPVDVFPCMGRSILNRMLADTEHLDFIRMVIGESGRFPQLAQIFIQNLTKYSLEFLSRYIAAHPEMAIPDPDATARIILGSMIFHIMSQKMLYGETIIPLDGNRLVDALTFLMFRGTDLAAQLPSPPSRPRLVLASQNSGKLNEFQVYLAELDLEISLMPAELDIPETESTFLGNACLKATAVAQATGEWAIADDSGLEVEALDGAPGIYSARYGRNDQERISRLLDELGGELDRQARFVCALAVARPDGSIALHTQGECVGEILRAPRGDGGFGYDPIFYVPSQAQTFAEMSRDTKRQISHRGVAFQTLLPELKLVIGQDKSGLVEATGS